MPSHIVVIAASYPQHLVIAIEHGFWDFTRRRDVHTGDDVYFWIAGSGLAAHVRASSDTRALHAEDTPWEDSGERSYTHRLQFTVVSDSPRSNPTWTEMQTGAGTRRIASNGFVTIPDEGSAWLAAVFSTPRIDQVFGREVVTDLSSLRATTREDERSR